MTPFVNPMTYDAWLLLGALQQQPPAQPPPQPYGQPPPYAQPAAYGAPGYVAPGAYGAQPVTGEASAFPGWRLALQTEAAFGVTGETFFYNHLAGVRLDRRFTQTVALGGYLGYVNLKGKQSRASNVLPYLMLEIRPLLGDSVGVPLRVASGYLPKNGPFLRMSAGLTWISSDSFEIGADLVVPTVWVTSDQPVVSMDVALEVAFGF